MSLAHFRILINYFLNNDVYIVTDAAPISILYSKSAVCMDNSGKDIKHTGNIYGKVHFVRNSDSCKIHKIDWCELGLQLADIATKNVGENYLNPRMK